MSSAGRPVKLNTTLMTGMLMFGKISVGVRSADAVPKIRISTAMTINVYGRRRARRTTPIITFSLVNDVAVAPPILAAICVAPWRVRQPMRFSQPRCAIFATTSQNLGLSFAFVKCILFILTCEFRIVMEFQSLEQDGAEA